MKTVVRPRFGSAMRLGVASIAIVLTMVVTATSALSRQDDLSAIRQATAPFHDLDAAIAAGYELGYVNGSNVRIITNCVAHPSLGAMGYHYFHKGLVDDLVIDLERPEGLVYAPGPNGTLQLRAVEYVVPGSQSNPPGVSSAPILFGQQMVILVANVGFYTRHVWLWGHNPSGIFAHWSPQVDCP